MIVRHGVRDSAPGTPGTGCPGDILEQWSACMRWRTWLGELQPDKGKEREVAMVVRMLEGWQDLPIEGVVEYCRDLVEDVDYPTVKRWRENGGKVVGRFQVYFPDEIVAAAGMLPLSVRGGSFEVSEAGAHFGGYLCSIVKTSLELALTRKIVLDMFVSHPICDSARNLAAVYGRNFDYPCEILYLPQNANSAHAITYLRGEYDRLKRDVEDVAGHRISDDDLRAAIVIFNENRRLLREMYAIRRDSPWLLAVDEAYVLMAVGGMVPRQEHNELLRYALDLVGKRNLQPQDRMRLVLEGGFCEQPPLDLLHTIGQFSYVVDDDLLIGSRWITEDVSTEGDPLGNLADAYLEHSSYSAVQHDLRKPKEKMLLDRIKDSGASAAIITAAKMCEPGLDEQVAYIKALDEEGVPYFVSEFEESMTSFDSLQIQLETFIENILFV
ncbi:MAG: 2-hydroxyacyl-CoA dehydratase [Actinobacteria bacterium]|nr:2-hydroxyacyl-CoA dehydratase [Actinomycetota bacterium]MCL5447264.1 2-hydroxyacyl-CoA dehydratase [Actinomycetota bacterium]